MHLYKLTYDKNQSICKNKLLSALSLTPLSEIYSPQKNQILVPGYLVPLSVYYTLSNDQAVSHTHTPAVNACTWTHCRLLRISPDYWTFCEEQWEIPYHRHLPPDPLVSTLPYIKGKNNEMQKVKKKENPYKCYQNIKFKNAPCIC